MSTVSREIFLKDYKKPNYLVENINLDVEIFDDYVEVLATTNFYKNDMSSLNSLELNGVDLELLGIWIDDSLCEKDSYRVDSNILYLKNLPEKFKLKTKVKLKPDLNFSGEGFYNSGNIYCTQCEAEGFRRITYYLDRPDVMTLFTTKITADKSKYPKLLSNGNNIDSGELSDNKHFVIWQDPFKKPAYLFAMVAGDLALVTDSFTTCTQRIINLEIYVDHGNEDKCSHAMESLKNSMKWDEEKFGLEYDLDIYMVVAVDSFNMGAMENKGLNIFNSAYVLAKKETATDNDFQGIEAVIGHEYFHNWTGNRVTCRDWFQLTLKEGLTVFRDQEFSSDMLSRPVKRIDDVKGLRGNQFPEDGGPMSHPIKPKSFVEINNFYTATIYEKGAEVIRMIHTLIGAEKFRKGMDLYFKRHDGQAVTTEDFVQAMSDASEIDLEQFKVWYDQNGTPILNITDEYDPEGKVLSIKIEQLSKLNNSEFDSLHMPFHLSLYTNTGDKISIKDDGKYELKEKVTILEFIDIPEKPIASFNNNFTAPVNVNYEYDQESLSVLMAHDQDEFNQYDAAQKMAELEIQNLVHLYKTDNESDVKVSDSFINSYKALLVNKELDSAFKAYALSLPTVKEINDRSIQFDFEFLPKAISRLRTTIATTLKEDLLNIVYSNDQKGEFQLSAGAMGERSLKNFALKILFDSNSPDAIDLIYSHFQNATNMTDEISSLGALVKRDNPYRERAISTFYNKWKDDTLVMQKWLSIQAYAEDTGIEKIMELEKLEIYNPKIPNLIRALISAFATYNTMNFNNIDGSGYRFFTSKILEVDKINPQIAAGMCKKLNFLSKLDAERAELLKVELRRIIESNGLSSDTLEVAGKNLSN